MPSCTLCQRSSLYLALEFVMGNGPLLPDAVHEDLKHDLPITVPQWELSIIMAAFTYCFATFPLKPFFPTSPYISLRRQSI